MAFLAFEGLDGSGKSTLIKNLGNHLKEAGISFIQTREPGGTDLGEELRQIILKDQTPAPCAKAELLLYEAIRAQHVECKIKPSLDKGNWVVCDRFTASSIAFQAGGRKIAQSEIEWLNDFATSSLAPDLTILLDITYENSQKRMLNNNRDSKDRIENEGESFHKRVRESYVAQAENNDDWLVLDACKSEEDLTSELVSHLLAKGFLK